MSLYSHENLGEVERSNSKRSATGHTGLFFSVAASLLCQAWKQSTKFLGSAIVCQVHTAAALAVLGSNFQKGWSLIWARAATSCSHILRLYMFIQHLKDIISKHVQSLQAKLKVVKVEVATKNALQGICRIWKIPWRPADQEERKHVTRSQRC